MIKACFLVKYPPIEGGVSMTSYWIARGLAERGHQIFVVTNANEVEDEYRIHLDETDEAWYQPRFESSGGFVEVRQTPLLSDSQMHIPQSNPFVTKLSSIATQVIRQHGCEVIFSYYLQPYGLAAHLASHWTGIPYLVKHAGSDLGRLMKQRDLTTAYREVLRAADCVWTGLNGIEPFLAMGVREENIWAHRISRVPPIFSPQATPLALNELLSKLASSESEHVRNVLINTTPIPLSRPTIGIYGKVGEVKGSFDLLRALGLLKRRGLDFNLVALTQGKAFASFTQAIEDHRLEDRTWTFPFIPHWKIPGFIRACTAVCFLERDFPIAFHAPTVPQEALACGAGLILSREIVEKQPGGKDRFLDGKNVLIIDDPKQHLDLAKQLRLVIEDPVRAREIGLQGYNLYHELLCDSPIGGRGLSTSIEAVEKKLVELTQLRAVEPPPNTVRTELLDDQRRERLKAQLPWTSTFLAESWDQLVNQYCQEHRSSPGNQFRDAMDLCEFLASKSPDRSGGNGCLKDILKYERTHNSLYIDREAELLAQPAQAIARQRRLAHSEVSERDSLASKATVIRRQAFIELQRKAPAEALELKPIRAKGVRVESFSHNLKELVSSMHRGRPLAEVPSEQTFILFKKEFNFMGLEQKISEATKYLLDLCDGRHTIRALIAELARFYPNGSEPQASQAELTDDVLKLLQELIPHGIVKLLQERPAAEPVRQRRKQASEGAFVQKGE